MKKYILTLLIGFALSFVASAQTNNMGTVTSGGVTAAYLYVNPMQATKMGSAQFNVTRVSTGTIGQIILQCSNDGTNWLSATASDADSLHISNSATQSLMYKWLASTGLVYKQYRFKCTQIAGDTATVVGYFYGRQ